jgi:hypothetical protein
MPKTEIGNSCCGVCGGQLVHCFNWKLPHDMDVKEGVRHD